MCPVIMTFTASPPGYFRVSSLPPPPTAVNEDRSLQARLKTPAHRENRFLYRRGRTPRPHRHEVVLDIQAPCSADSSFQGGQGQSCTVWRGSQSGSELKFYLPNQLRRMCWGAGSQEKVWTAYKSDTSAAPELIFFVALRMLLVSSCLSNQLLCRIFSGSLLPLRSSPKAKLSVDSSPTPNNGNFLL